MKKVAVLLADGFEDIEALATVDILRRAGIYCNTISIREEYVKSAHGIEVKADKLMNEQIEEYDMVVCPGGLPGAKYLSEDERVLNTIRKFINDSNKYVAAICASPAMVLSAAGIEENRYITSYPGEEMEGTSRGPATTFLFAYKLVDILGGNSENLKEGMLWNMVEKEE